MEEIMSGSGSSGVWLVAGLGYGDEGKGTITDYLVRTAGIKTVIRYNGGAQAGHRVVLSDGRSHAFAQFGSGSFVPGVSTHLSRFMLIEPMSMMREGLILSGVLGHDPFSRLTIDGDALLITPFQMAVNRILETARGANRHGSCGLGINETMEDFLALGNQTVFVKDLLNPDVLRKKLKFMQERKLDKIRHLLNDLPDSEETRTNKSALENLAVVERWMDVYSEFMTLVKIVGGDHLRRLLKEGGAVFEGAQGVLLDRNYGFYPYNTGTDTTFNNAETLIKESGYAGEVKRVGVVRGYATRHGAGPFVTYDPGLTELLPDPENGTNRWQGDFRAGYFDVVATRYALDVIGGINYLAVTNLDRLWNIKTLKVCQGYKVPHLGPEEFFETWKGSASRIKVSRPAVKDYQRQLTEELWIARPDYAFVRPVPDLDSSRDYVLDLVSALGFAKCPGLILSCGDTAARKYEFSQLQLTEARD